MVGEVGPQQPISVNALRRQPRLTALIERKGISGALANRLGNQRDQTRSDRCVSAGAILRKGPDPRSGPPSAAGVLRQAGERDDGYPSDRTGLERAAATSYAFPLRINARWRVVDDPLQWILESRSGKGGAKNSGWRARSFNRTREGLLDRIREVCGTVDSGSRGSLMALPERHR